MREVKIFKCECYGIEFFNHSSKILNKGNKGLTCPFCGSAILFHLIAK